MEFKYRTVHLDRINSEDTRFKISSDAALPRLVASIQRLGLINAPILVEAPDAYRIVSGFNRIAACRQLDRTDIHVRVLDADTHLDRCVHLAIADNSTQRSLNLVEQAQAVALLSSCYADPVQLVDAAESLGLQINIGMAAKLQKLAGMNDLLKSGVADGTISLPVALQLEAMHDDTVANELATLVMELGLSLNRQREVLDWVLSISRREHIGTCQLLSDENIRNVRRSRELDRRQKSQSIREYLKKRRYPSIVDHEQRFARMVKQLNLPHGTHLMAPQHFESSIYSLKLDFQSRQEFLDRLKELDNLSKSEILKKLWDDMASI